MQAMRKKISNNLLDNIQKKKLSISKVYREICARGVDVSWPTFLRMVKGETRQEKFIIDLIEDILSEV